MQHINMCVFEAILRHQHEVRLVEIHWCSSVHFINTLNWVSSASRILLRIVLRNCMDIAPTDSNNNDYDDDDDISMMHHIHIADLVITNDGDQCERNLL
jgi:hypothetical protein